MPQICTRVSDYLYQQLELKAQELNTEKSALVRDFIRVGLSNLQTNSALYSDVTELLKQSINYTIMSHCLIDKAISDYVENGAELCSQAHSKAEKLVNNLLQKLSKAPSEPIEFVQFKTDLGTND